MKKTFLYLWGLLAAVFLMPVSLTAQSWTASAPADGESYYLYNVGEGRFISGGNDWGTFMSLFPKNGVSVTLEATGTNLYKIATSPTYSGLYMGNDLYIDKAASDGFVTDPWEIKPISGMTDTYSIKETRKNRYLTIVSGQTKCSWLGTSEPTATDTHAHWQLVSRDAYITYMRDNASATHPIDATLLLVNANFGRNASTSNWTGSPAIGGKNENMCAEKWNTTFDVSQTISGVPNGVYTMDIQGFYRMGGGGNDAAAAGAARAEGTEALNAIYYINSAEGHLKSIFEGEHCATNNGTYNTSTAVNINGTNYYVPTNMNRASECFDAGDYQNEPIRVTVTDGTIHLGVKKSVASTNDWSIFDNITLTYYGVDMTAMLEQAKADWQSKYEAIVSQALDRSSYDQVIAAADTYCINEDRLTEYHSIVWQAVCDLMKNGTTATGQFDITSLVANPTFETGTTGWTTDGTPGHSTTNGVAEFWNQPACSLTQTLSDMPEGTYTLKAQAFYRTSGWREAAARYQHGEDVVKGFLMLAGQQQSIWNVFDQSRYQYNDLNGIEGGSHQGMAPNNLTGTHTAFELGLYWNQMTTTTTADGDLTFGIGINDGLEACWMPFDNFRLYYGAEKIAVNLTNGVPTEDTQASTVTTNITLNAGDYNKVCLPFDLDATKTAAAFTHVFQLAGVTSDGVGQLVPAYSIEAGKAYFVTVDATTTLTVSDVLVKVAQPDSIPVMWEGAATVGNYNGFTFTINGSTINSFAPVDFQNMSFTVNQENWRARRFLNEFTYDSSVASKIRAYNAGYPVPLDHPHSVFIPVPTNNAALTVTVSTNNDFSDAETFTFDAGTNLCELPNLIPQNTYYYKVEGAGSILTKGQFQTEGHLRMIKVNTGFNIRDLGGWLNLDNNRVKYGKVFRSGELNFGHILSDSDIAELKRLGIGAEIDWRRDDETANSTPTLSVLSDDPNDYLYLNHDYANMRYDYDVNKQHYKQAFEFMLEHLRQDKAVIFHCRIGADRTGQFALLLDGLCGLPFDQLCKDYELTSFSEAGTREWDSTGSNNLKTNLEYIQTLPGSTLQRQFFYYLNTEVGIDANDLFDFIDIMVGDATSLENCDLTFNDLSNAYLQSLDEVGASCSLGSTVKEGAKAQLSDGETTVPVDMTIDNIMVTFSGVTLEPGKDYTITIPAGSIEKDGVENAADASTTFHTPVAFDGVYYLYNQFADGFLSGGSNWGTSARVDKYGLPFQWTVNREGIGSILFIDNNNYLYGNDWSFIDGLNNTDRPTNFYTGNVSNVEGFEGVQLSNIANANGWIFLYVYYKPNDSRNYNCASNGFIGDNCDTAEQSVWQFWTKEQRNARISNYPTQNIQNVITASGITADATTFDTVLATNYVPVDCSSAVGTITFGNGIGNWTYTETSGSSGYPDYGNRDGNEYARLWEATGKYTLTIPAANVPAGIYKVELGAFERHTDEAGDTRLWNDGYANPSTSYLAVNDEQVQFTSWYQMNQNADADGQTAVYAGQSLAQQSAFVAAGYADISLYVYHDGTTDLKLTISIPTRLGQRYCVFNNLRLTQYVKHVILDEMADVAPQAATNVNVTFKRTIVSKSKGESNNAWNTICFPFALTQSQIQEAFGANTIVKELSSVSMVGDKASLTFAEVTAIEANKPYIMQVATGADEYTFQGIDITPSNDLTVEKNGLQFVGNYIYPCVMTNDGGTDYYILNDLFKSSTGRTKIKGFRAYFHLPASSGIKTLGFDEDEATGIFGIEANEAQQEIYDLQGRKVNGPLTKGIYIVNGKKTFVK